MAPELERPLPSPPGRVLELCQRRQRRSRQWLTFVVERTAPHLLGRSFVSGGSASGACSHITFTKTCTKRQQGAAQRSSLASQTETLTWRQVQIFKRCFNLCLRMLFETTTTPLHRCTPRDNERFAIPENVCHSVVIHVGMPGGATPTLSFANRWTISGSGLLRRPPLRSSLAFLYSITRAT